MVEVHSPSSEVIDTLNKANNVGFIDDFLRQLSEASENGLTPEEKNHILTLKQTHKTDEKGFEKASIGYLTSLYGTEIIPSYGAFIAQSLAFKHGFDKDILIKYFSDYPENILNLSEIRKGEYSTVLFFGDQKITIQTLSQKEAQTQDQQEITTKAIQALEQEKQQLSREVMYDGALILGLATIANTTHHFVKDVWIKTNTGIDHIEFSQGEITGTKSNIKTRILYELTKQRGFFLNPADKIFHKSENYLRAREIRTKYGIGNLSNINYEDYKWMVEVSGDTSSLSFEQFTQAQQNLVGYEQRLKADYQAYLRTTNSPMSEIEFFTQRQYIESVGKIGLGSASLNVLFMPYIFSPLRENGEDITSIIKIAHDEAAFLVGGKAAYNAWEKIPLERGGVVGKGIKGVGGILAYMGGGIAGMQIAPSSLQALGVNLDKKAWKYMPDREGESGQKSLLGHILTLGALNDLADKYDINIGVPGFEPLQLAKTDVDFATNPRIYLNNRISDTSLWDERIERFSQTAGSKIYDAYLQLQNKAITQEDFSQEIINILYGGIPPTQAEDILYLNNLISTLIFEGDDIHQDEFTKFFHDTAQSKKLTPDNIQKLQEKNDLLLSELYVKILKLPEDKKEFTEKLIERIIHEKNLLEANNVTFTPTNTLMGFQSKVEISQERKFYDELIDSPDGDLFIEILNQAVAYKRENVFLRNISLNGYAQNWTLLPKNKNMAENAEKNIPTQNETAERSAEKVQITQETQAQLAEELQGTQKRDFILKKMDETFVQFSSVFKEVLDHNIIKPKIEQYNILKEKVKACQSDGDLKKINGEVRKLIGDLKNSMLETPDLSWEEQIELAGKVDRKKVTQTQELAGHNIVEVESILDQLDGISQEQIAANKKERIEAIAKQTSQKTGTEKEEFTKMLSGMGVPAAASGMIVGLASMMGFISDDPNKPSFFATILEFFKDPMGAFGRMLAGEPILKPKTNTSPVETTSQETQTAQVKTTETNTGVEEKKSKIETIGNIQKYNGENFILTMKDGKIDEIKSKTGVIYEANIKGFLFENQNFPAPLELQTKEDGSVYITGDDSRNEIPLSVVEEKFAQQNVGNEIQIMKGYTREGKFSSQNDLYFEKKGAINGFFS